MAKGQGDFGHTAIAKQLVRRLQAHFVDSKADASFVMGIFGEWGSGKSNLLHLIREGFAAAMRSREASEAEDTAPPVIVVAFNPWRYEKEEHLFVPLLKTMQLSIQTHLQAHAPLWARLGLVEKLKQGGAYFALAALAFLAAFKGKFTLPDAMELEVEPGKFAETFFQYVQELEKEDSPLAKLESHYYQFERELREFVTQDPPIRLLFLIDDLDRCLPEKAVEMLESIKLFLDVEACAFVLALDDEVIERGIVHRYRDYIFQGNGQRVDDKSLAQLPITGHEYLEKIIHLPFRLPQPSRLEIRRFLIARFPHLFDASPVDVAETLGEPSKLAGRMSGQADPRQAEELLNLFVNHIPPVPRKQIRSAELVSLLLDMASARQCGQQIKLLPLAKLALLQLFAPELYRFGRRRFLGFMRTLQGWTVHEHWGQKDFGKLLQEQIKTPAQNNALSESEQIEARNYDRFYAPLIEALETSAHTRSGFDPFQFIKNLPLPDEDMQDLTVYFSFVDETVKPTEKPASDVSALPVGELANVDEFLDLLFSATEGSWQSALQTPELQGRTLSDATFGLVLGRLQKDEFKAKLENPDWLKWLLPRLSAEQFSRLATPANHFAPVLPADLPNNPTDENAKALFGPAQLLAKLRPDQQAILPKPVEAMRDWLTGIVEKHQLEVATRAEVGRILSDIGDPRKGVGCLKAKRLRGTHENHHHLPDIDWQEIPAGSFRMGSDTGGYEDEKPAHELAMPRFFISRHAVTNAQYRCFIEAGLYEDGNFWQTRLPQAASQWLAGGAADEKLLESIAESYREDYRNWLQKDQDRSQPRFWSDAKWNLDNHPVVGVSWFEALAYTVWLNDCLAAQMPSHGEAGPPLTIRLPTEAEWEYAARGGLGLEYAWGKGENPALGNYDGTKLGRTTAVGLFPPGEAFGLYDMSGNVWEWTLSRWGKNFAKPDFTYQDWQKQEKTRNLVGPVEFRVVRGGAWYDRAGDVRCAFRLWVLPDGRDVNVGFRVVLGGVLPGDF